MRRVVIIDDHQPSRRRLVTLLNNGGYEIAGEGASGKVALALARTVVADVILMAVGLSDVDGIETSRDVMRHHPLPIILTTSHYDAATIDRAKRAGVMGYLVKPLRAEELSPAIELAITRFQDFVALRAENTNLKETLEARKTIERAKGPTYAAAPPVGRAGLYPDEENQHEHTQTDERRRPVDYSGRWILQRG